MPSYEYSHKTATCEHFWEEWRSIKDCFPKDGNIKCPKCEGTESITLLVSGGSGRGRVELGKRELIEKTNADAVSLAREVYTNENAYANMVGEDTYHKLQKRYDSQK